MYQFPSDPPRWISPRHVRRPLTAAFSPGPGDKRVPDLQSQLEGLLDAVWAAEANWRLDDRIDGAVRYLR